MSSLRPNSLLPVCIHNSKRQRYTENPSTPFISSENQTTTTYNSSSDLKCSLPSQFEVLINEEDLPSDTLIALQILRSKHVEMLQEMADKNFSLQTNATSDCSLYQQHLENYWSNMPPILLRTHLQTMLQNSTQMDRELAALKKQNRIREFRLPTGNVDYAFVIMEDYKHHITKKKMATLEGDLSTPSSKAHLFPHGSNGKHLFDLFLDEVLPHYLDLSISKKQLLNALSLSPKNPNCEMSISSLVHAGLLTMYDSNSFWFSIPSAGRFVQCCIDGRKEILALLSKKKWNEMFMERLEKKKLKRSLFPASFHTRDLQGKGMLKCIPTRDGLLVKLMDNSNT